MVKSAYEWHGPFKYQTNGEGFYYGKKFFWTKAGYKRWIVQGQANDRVYEDDELHARRIRANANRYGNHDFQIFDELPDGWHRGIYEHGGRFGLNGRRDTTSKYEWCETDIPMYRNAYPGDSRVNPGYRQALVKRA